MADNTVLKVGRGAVFPPGVVVRAVEPDFVPRARQLLQWMQSHGLSPAAATADWLLAVGPTGLTLFPAEDCARSGLRTVFWGGPLAWRRRHPGGRELLARAVGLKSGRRPRILDATAGLGRDAFVLAAIGCQVKMLERSALLALLLVDALQRAWASEQGDLRPVLERLSLECVDAVGWLAEADPSEVDVICLDPMFPVRRRNVAARRQMVLLQQLEGNADEGAELLEAALASGVSRVVVKRPGKASPLGRVPNYSIKGSAIRFDVYLSG